MFFIYAVTKWIVMPFAESEQIGREAVWGSQQIKHSVLDLDKFKISTRHPVAKVIVIVVVGAVYV